jgi:late competence protein required for DNA uptake (superfamily II DNA/RNA helicase)
MDQEYDQVEMECNHCHLKFFASQMKLDLKDDLLYCPFCINSKRSKVTIIKDRPLRKE